MTTGHAGYMKPVVIGMGDFQAELVVVSIGFPRFNFESVGGVCIARHQAVADCVSYP